MREILHFDAFNGDVVDVDEGVQDILAHHYPRRRRNAGRNEYPKVPNTAGRFLMKSGTFGDDPYFVDEEKKRKRTLATSLMYRELGIDPDGVRKRQKRSLGQVCVTFIRWKKGNFFFFFFFF